METLAYTIIAIITLIFSSRAKLINSKGLFYTLFIFLFLSLSAIVRQYYDTDIQVYSYSMMTNIHSIFTLDIYYIREPIVWIGQNKLFELLGSTFIVFLICDFILANFLYAALTRLLVPQYVFFAIMLFFPFVLGMQNVYRQWASTIFFLYSASYAIQKQSNWRSYAFAIIAVLSHNVAAVFFPILFINARLVLKKFIFLAFIALTAVGVILGEGTKSDASTGFDLRNVYVILFLIVLCFFLSLDKFRLSIFHISKYRIVFFILFIAIVANLSLSSSSSERISMFGLIILYPLISTKIEEIFKQKFLIRITFIILGSIPILFTDARDFILYVPPT